MLLSYRPRRRAVVVARSPVVFFFRLQQFEPVLRSLKPALFIGSAHCLLSHLLALFGASAIVIGDIFHRGIMPLMFGGIYKVQTKGSSPNWAPIRLTQYPLLLFDFAVAAVTEKATEALRRIAQESPLKKYRVRRYGVNLD